MTDISNLSSTIKPKSDQSNYDDLVTGPITVTVTAVAGGNAEQPVKVSLSGGYQPYFPCKSMRRVLIAAWGDDGRKWVGRSMTLYGDPEVVFGGVKVGGIRISHLTHIDGPRDFMLTTTRSKRKAFHVEPLAADAPTTASPFWPQDKFAAKLAGIAPKIQSGERTEADAVAWFEKTAPLTSAQKSEIAGLVPASNSNKDEF